MNSLKLHNGVEMPQIGLGTYPMKGEELANAVSYSYQIGYRLIDTSDNYYNEEDLGLSLKRLFSESDAKREELFIISKISDELYQPGTLGGGTNKGKYFWRTSPEMAGTDSVKRVVRKKLYDSLKFIRTDYLDSLLVHWPYPDYFEEIWHEMESIYKEGYVRSIGVCNCRERHLLKLEKSCSVMPHINQFESSPLNSKESLVKFCKNKDIQIMTYSPLMNLRFGEYLDYKNYLHKLSVKYNKTVSQIVLRYNIDMGLVPIPKSSKEFRLRENFNIFDFKITDEELKILLSFNCNKQYLFESKACPGL